MNGGGGHDLVLRPHPLMIVVRPLRHVVMIVLTGVLVVLGAGVWRWAGLGPGVRTSVVVPVVGLVLLMRLVWAVADWAARVYGVSGGVVWSERGVLHRRRDELPVSRVQSVALDRPVSARVLGLGTIGFASAGTPGYEVVWLLVGRPRDRLAAARRAIGVREEGL